MASFDSVKPGTLYHRLKAGSGQGLVHGRHHIVCTCNAFVSDPEWLHVRDESEKDGAIVAHISNQVLSPTSFSALA
jgi:hypothetical protein